MSELDPKLTFETFVVGPANRLAAAAARRVADSPGKAYNPLFVYSASGLGKSHILNALAHQARKVHPTARVQYLTTERYLDELAQALSAGVRDELRDEYANLDLLLLDDVQFLTGQTEAQEILLRTLDILTGSGKQIVLASDRPPAEINGMDARLVSRFSGGLLVDIGTPEYETRVAIMRRQAQSRGMTLGAGVAEQVARIPFRNVRELQGGLNRILAIQELEGREVTPDEARRLVGALDDATPSEVPEPGPPEPDPAAEELWVARLRASASEAEAQGFSAARLRRIVDSGVAPEDPQAVELAFQRDLDRLREIRRGLDEVGNPWPEAAQGVLRDPDRMEEAEALLASARERMAPFPSLGDGPELSEISGMYSPLAMKAAEQLVRPGHPDYNPVVLVCPDSGYAARLLEAAGRTFRARNPEAKVGLVSAASFAEDFIRALSHGVAGAWRERWWEVDLLLVPDAQGLAATERAQDEFFHLFEALKRRGGRMFLASDRPPGAMEGVDDRLRSRFDAGLVVEDEASPSQVRRAEKTFGPVDAVGPLASEGGSEAPSGSGFETADGPPDQGGDVHIPPLADLEISEGGLGGLFFDREPQPEPEPEAEPEPEPDPESGSEVDPGPTPAPEPPAPPRRPAAAAPEPDAWFPSPEKVVWEWPDLDDHIVEED